MIQSVDRFHIDANSTEVLTYLLTLPYGRISIPFAFASHDSKPLDMPAANES